MKSTDVKEIYDNDYFLKQVDGYQEFDNFNGEVNSLTQRYRRNIELLGLHPHHKFLEIGCGRGEICIYHAKTGGLATGVDFSGDAIKIAQVKASKLNLNINFIESSFDKFVSLECSFDRILASEFIEHVSRSEGDDFFKSSYKILSPGGKLFVFTYPNTLYRKYGYPIQRFMRFFYGKPLPKVMDDTTSDHYKKYHLNEQNFISLRRMVRNAGFCKYKIDYDLDQPSNGFDFKYLIRYLISKTPMRHILLCNLYVIAEK